MAFCNEKRIAKIPRRIATPSRWIGKNLAIGFFGPAPSRSFPYNRPNYTTQFPAGQRRPGQRGGALDNACIMHAGLGKATAKTATTIKARRKRRVRARRVYVYMSASWPAGLAKKKGKSRARRVLSPRPDSRR